MKLFDLIMKFFAWLAILWIVTLCWVGAEYVFEGAVHSSSVDSGIAGLLAYQILLNVIHIEKKYVGRQKEA